MEDLSHLTGGLAGGYSMAATNTISEINDGAPGTPSEETLKAVPGHVCDPAEAPALGNDRPNIVRG